MVFRLQCRCILNIFGYATVVDWILLPLAIMRVSITMRISFWLLFTLTKSGSSVLLERPWLNASLPTELRLQLFLSQLNATQKFDMLQGDTEVSMQAQSSSEGL